jgi:Cation transport ATPase
MNDRWYDKTVEQLEDRFKTSIRKGLNQKVAFKRKRHFGPNLIYPIPRGSFRSYLKHIVTDFTSILLIITAIIAAVFENNLSSAVIIGILILNYGLAIFSYVKAQRVLEDMGVFALPSAKVIRDGRLYLIKQEDLVPGDIIHVAGGDIVPCDARLFETDELEMLEGKLTGFERPVEKSASFIDHRELELWKQKNMIFASTIVAKGIGRAIVCATGDNTQVCINGKNNPIVSHEQLSVIGVLKKYCSVWSLVMLAVVFVLTVVDLMVGTATRGLFDIFFTGLSLAVASMSEFYMAFGYIVIACGIFGAVQRFKDINSGAMVKKTVKLEKLKDLTCLVVPKECAFSIKNMRVERIFANSNVYGVNDYKFIDNCRQVIQYGLISTGLYGRTKLVESNLKNENIYTAEEDSIIHIAEKFNLYNVELDKNFPIVEHVPMSDNSLFETTLVETGGTHVVAARGELHRILDNCRYYTENGNIYPLTSEKISSIKISASLITREAYRVIGVASKTTIHKTLTRLDACQTDMIFEGFMAVREPMLPGAAKNISKCQAAGIKIIMLCEDISENNRFLAESLGIAHDYTDIINTYEMAEMKDGLFRANIPIYRVYEGLSVSQKQLLLEYLKEDGEVVGFLGREINEIPLLEYSDVSFAQSVTVSVKAGKKGVDLTNRAIPMQTKDSKYSSKGRCEAVKFSADVIISDADKQGRGGFNAIIDALMFSKVVYKNLIRVIKYLITVQSARLFLILYSVISHEALLNPIQILFSGLLIDFAAVIIIAFEKPSNDILKQPIDTEKRLENPLWHNTQCIIFGLFWAVIMVIAVEVLDYYYIANTVGEMMSGTFITFILTQIITLNETMKERSLFIPNVRINGIYLIVFVAVAAFIVFGMLFPQFGTLFGIYQINLIMWGAVVAIPLCMLILYEIYKALVTMSNNNKSRR